MSTSPVTAKTISLLKLALQPKNIKLIQFNQKQEVINLLIQVPDEIDPAQIASMIWAMDAQLKISQVSCVKLYKQVAGKSSPELFSSIDLTQLPTSEDNPFSDSPPIEIEKLNDVEQVNTNSSDHKTTVNLDLGLKQRAKLGDLQAIKQFLDLALIHKNATTIVRLEDQKLIVIIESKTKLDQQTIVMIMKRQLNLLNSSVFSSAEIKAKRSNEVDWIEDIHFTALNVIAKRKSNSGIDKNLLMKIAVACGGVFVLGIVGFFGTHTRIPDVTGQQVSYAEGILKGKELEIKVTEQIEENITPGQIITQVPDPQSFLLKGKEVQVTIAKAPTYTITGSMLLIDSDIGGTSQNCYGTGGYDDMQGGMSVTIQDGSGQILATSQTGQGYSDSPGFLISCKFDFSVEVPKSDFYTIKLGTGRRGSLNYSLQEMKEMGWEVNLSLS